MNLFIRSYCVNPQMDRDGGRIGGTVGTLKSIKKLINDFSPSNVLVVWDGEGGSQRRKQIYSAYKAGRTVRLNEEYDFGESPEERLANLRRQRNLAIDYLTLLGVPQVRADGVEADDMIAYLAANVDHPGGTIVVTTDQDMLQLIREEKWAEPCEKNEIGHVPYEHDIGRCSACGAPRQSEVKVWSPIKKVMYDCQTFLSEYGIIPENFRLVKAITGDKSDNIEGIKGFGAKTVAKSFPFLLERRSSADEVLRAAEELGSTLGKRLVEKKERFLENLELVDLSAPMLSVVAARQARDALWRPLACREVEFRIKVVKDGVSFTDDKFVQPIRDFVMRRKKLLERIVPEQKEVVEEFDGKENE